MTTLDRWIRAFAFKVWQQGLLSAIKLTGARVWERLTQDRDKNTISTVFSAPKRDVFSSFAMVLREEELTAGETYDPIKSSTINWIIPPFSLGSGGHLNIFRMIVMLEKYGYHNRIYIVGSNRIFNTGKEARQQIIEHFAPIQAEVTLGAEQMQPSEFTFATSWDTAYWVQYAQACKHKLYFVQDFEPFFYAHGSEYAFAEATYRMGLIAITAGQWLTDILRRDYGMSAVPFGFSYDKDFYFPRSRDNSTRRVFFYARHVTPRRGFELGLLALSRLHERMPDIEFVLAGWDTSEFNVPFPHLNAGVVTLSELPALYSQCDVALVLSFTNLSLLPLEVMACGCPVVSNRGPNTEWLLHDGENALLCESTPQDIAATLERLLDNEPLRQQLIQSGLAFAKGTDWQTEGARVASYLDQLHQGKTLGQ